MKSINIKLTRDNYNFRFKQYEGMYFHAEINENNEIVKYKNKIYYEISLSDYNMFRYIQM